MVDNGGMGTHQEEGIGRLEAPQIGEGLLQKGRGRYSVNEMW